MMERWTKRTDGGVLLSEEHDEKYTFIELIDILLDRLAYYEDMEEQGRLVVLPCKVGDTLFDIYEAKANGEDEVKELKVTDIHIHLDKRNKVWLIVGGYYFALADFGKTVFLTREEAEQALKGGAN